MGVRDLTGKAHELLSLEVLLPLARLQRTLRPSRRPTVLAFYNGMRFRREATRWSPEQKREWTLQRLRYIVRRAPGETPYYRELFERIGFDPQVDFSFEEFSRLPVLERDDVRRAGRDLVSPVVPVRQLRRDSTGGSTGEPTVVWLGPEDNGWRESGSEYFMQKIGVPTGTKTGLLWGHHLDPVARDGLLNRYHDFESNVRWFDCFRLSTEVLERYHQEFERWRPACIIAYAGALGSLAEHVLERGHRTHYPTRSFVTGAEKLMAKHREAIEKAFGRPVHERYGSRDVGLMGFQLRPATTLDYEIDWANVLIEPEAADTADAAILVTKLHADGMPMLRYRVGDRGLFPEGSAPGSPTFELREVLGRDTARIWLPDGRWIHGIQLPHMMKDHPVREFMFRQRSDYSIELEIVPRSGFGEESRRSILDAVAANLPGLSVTLVLVDDIERTKANKWQPVISEVKTPRR